MTSLQPAWFNGTQAQTLKALANIDNAVFDSNKRVEHARDKILNRLKEALEESEHNNRILEKRIAQLTRKNKNLELQINELNECNDEQMKAQKKFKKAVQKLLNLIEGECEQILTFAQEHTSTHTPNKPLDKGKLSGLIYCANMLSNSNFVDCADNIRNLIKGKPSSYLKI